VVGAVNYSSDNAHSSDSTNSQSFVINAFADGIISSIIQSTSAKELPSNNNQKYTEIAIQHKGGYESLYKSRFKELFVQQGQIVKAGEQIGLIQDNSGDKIANNKIFGGVAISFKFDLLKDGKPVDLQECIKQKAK